ncbi:hypothetical protein F4780DRAFT_791054 [Xylariomycetidae sp. FL0641]|nr:hypothetical protein F4780DRAFT_791054 [Xylariomycetidae sp. FL0641]
MAYRPHLIHSSHNASVIHYGSFPLCWYHSWHGYQFADTLLTDTMPESSEVCDCALCQKKGDCLPALKGDIWASAGQSKNGSQRPVTPASVQSIGGQTKESLISKSLLNPTVTSFTPKPSPLYRASAKEGKQADALVGRKKWLTAGKIKKPVLLSFADFLEAFKAAVEKYTEDARPPGPRPYNAHDPSPPSDPTLGLNHKSTEVHLTNLPVPCALHDVLGPLRGDHVTLRRFLESTQGGRYLVRGVAPNIFVSRRAGGARHKLFGGTRVLRIVGPPALLRRDLLMTFFAAARLRAGRNGTWDVQYFRDAADGRVEVAFGGFHDQARVVMDAIAAHKSGTVTIPSAELLSIPFAEVLWRDVVATYEPDPCVQVD